MSSNKTNLYDKYRQDKAKLNQIREKLRYLEQLSPEEQNNKYFKQDISKEIWEKKYKATTDKSIVDTWKRVAKFIAQAEKPEEREIWYLYFFDLLEGFKFTGAGRILANSDPLKKNVTLNNCYFSSKIEDSIDSIMEVAKEAAIIHKMGGGIGYNFSTIRPKGALVKSTGGTASGPISFAHIYNEVCRTITSIGGRFGAQILLLDVSHPDIEEFITAKESTDSHAPLTRFNLSVLITDDFMDAVKNNKDWNLVFDGKVYKTVKARYLWDLITKHAYDYAEPGIINIDIANKYNNLYWIEKEHIWGNNPSLPAGTLVYTTEGIKPIETLEDKFFFTKNMHGKIVKAKCFKSGNNKPVYKLELGKNKEIEATPEHKFPIYRNGKLTKLPVAELKVGDRILLPPVPDVTIDTESEDYKDGLFCGILFGDGYITQRKTGPKAGNYVMGFSFNQKDKEIAEFVLDYINSKKGHTSTIKERNREKMHELTIQISDQEFIKEIINKFELDISKEKLPERIWELNGDFVLGFLNGWISTDGSTNDCRLIVTNKSLYVIQQLTKLLSFYGIKGNITYRCTDKASFPNNKQYNRQYTQAVLKISRGNITKLQKILPALLCNRKNEQYKKIIPSNRKADIISNTVKITNIVPNYRKTDVWDITVYDDTHTFLMEYGVTGNCSEQNLPYNGSCNLGSFNLTQFVLNPFGKNNKFDFDKFYYYIPITVRFMDNVIDLTQQPGKKFEERQKFARRVGIGTTGLADLLVMLGIKYGTDIKCLSTLNDIYKALRNQAYQSSMELAKDKGPAPAVQSKEAREKYIQGNFIKQLPEDIRQDIVKYGIRNTFLLSIAPTGTISLLMNNISSGIEPIFSNSYIRHIRKSDHETEKREVMDYAYKLWKDKFGDKSLPNYWVTTKDLTIDDHLETMATIQKYIDTSISKTINIPTDYPFEDYKKIFTRAYELELKGITVYRPNSNLEAVLETKDDTDSTSFNNNVISREGQSSSGSSNSSENSNNPKNNNQKTNINKKKKRGFMLSGRTYKLKTPKEKYSYYVTINNFIDDEGNLRPFEIFINTKDPRQPIFGFISRLLSALFRREKDIDFIIKEMQSTLVHGEGFFDPKDGKHVPSTIAYIGKTIKYHLEQIKNNTNDTTTDNNKSSTLSFISIISGEGEKGEEEGDGHWKVRVDQFENPVNIEPPELIKTITPNSPFEICPECGMRGLKVENGCKTCIYCGYSGCE